MLGNALFGLLDQRPEGFRRRMERLGLGADASDAHALDHVAARDPHHHVQALHHLTEDGEIAVEVGPIAQHDAKLSGVGVGPAVGHVQRPGVIVAQLRVDLVGKV